MKKIFVALFAINLVVDFASWQLLPDPGAVHFGGNGTPNGWFSSDGGLIFNLLLHGGFFFIFYYSADLIAKTPKSLLNLPNKNYWLGDENLPEFLRRWNYSIYLLATAIMLLFLGVSLLILDANFSNPVALNNTLFIFMMLAFIVFIIYWITLIYRTFRIPP